MSKKLFSSLIGVILCAIMIATMIPFASADEITVTLVNPKAAIEAPKIISLAERSGSLEGKRIAFVGYSKDGSLTGANSHISSIADLLHEKYGYLSAGNPTGVLMSWANASAWSDVLGEKGVFAYDTYVRGASATTTNPAGVDAIIGGVAN